MAGLLHTVLAAHVIALWAGLPALRQSLRLFCPARDEAASISLSSNDMLWLDRPGDINETLNAPFEVHSHKLFDNSSSSLHANGSSQKTSASLPANESSENILASRFLYNDSNVKGAMPNEQASSLAQVIHTQKQNVDVKVVWKRVHRMMWQILLGIFLVAGFGVLPVLCYCWSEMRRSDASARFSDVVSSMSVPRKKQFDSSSSDGLGEVSDEDFDRAEASLAQHDYAWLDPEIANAQVGSPSPDLIELLPPTWSNSTLTQVFADNGIDANVWSDKQMTSFLTELEKGKCALVRNKDGRLQRRADIVSVLLVDPSDEIILQEFSHPPYMRDFGEFPELVPKTRMKRDETITDCISRCLHEKLNLTDPPIQIDSILSILEKAEMFPDHLPGLLSVTRRYVVLVHVKAPTQQEREALGLDSQRLEYDQYRFKWMDLYECHHLKAHFKRKAASKCAGLHDFGEPVLPWTPAAVENILRQHDIEDPTVAFGKTIEELSAELCMGKLALGICVKRMRLLCIQEDVSLLLTSNEGQIYMTKGPEHLLPSITKLSNENVHMAAYRLLAALFGSRATLAQVKTTAPVVTDQIASERGHVSKMVFVSAVGDSEQLFSEVANGATGDQLPTPST